MAAPKQQRSALGSNPLSQGIFTKTTSLESAQQDTASIIEPQASKSKKNQEKRIKKKESSFLIEEREEKVNLRLTVRTNDWLDNLLKQGRRQHGHKIPKEVWVQAALELLKAMPVDWLEISSEEELGKTLRDIESRIKNQESSD